MFFGSVQIISRLDSQCKFQMFTLFTYWRTKEVLQHGGSTLGSVTDFDMPLGTALLPELYMSSLFIIFNITISWLNPLHGFWFYFFIAWQCTRSIGRNPWGWHSITYVEGPYQLRLLFAIRWFHALRVLGCSRIRQLIGFAGEQFMLIYSLLDSDYHI